MEEAFSVEAIVAQIRSRIAEEKTRESSPPPVRLSVSEAPALDGAACRRRMEEDATRFAELDLRLEDIAPGIGQQPPAPPTFRGRFGGWIIQGLRRLLWWHALPVKEVVAQIGLRNREQAIRHRCLQGDLLELGESLQRAMSRIDGLEHTHRFDEALGALSERIAGAVGSVERLEQLAGTLNAKIQAEAQAREVLARAVDSQTDKLRQLTGALESLSSSRTRESSSVLRAEMEDAIRGRAELVGKKQQEDLRLFGASLQTAVRRIDSLEQNPQFGEALPSKFPPGASAERPYAQPPDNPIPFEECYWYATMDIPGHGVVEGEWDLNNFDQYIGGVDVGGRTLLDVGCASGYLSFEAERRGARVTSFDMASISQAFYLPFACNPYFQDRDEWDKQVECGLTMLKNSYWYAHRHFNSRNKVVYGDIFRLDRVLPEPVEVSIAGAIMEHLNDQISAIGSIARVTKKTIILAFTPIIDSDEMIARPILPLTDPRHNITWWSYSRGLYERVLANVGFAVTDIRPCRAHHLPSGLDVQNSTLIATRLT